MPWAATGSPCAALSPLDPSWGATGGRKTALRGSQGKKWGNGPGENPAGNRPTGREILEGPRRRRETPENMAALALRGPQGPLPGPAGSPFFPLGSRNQPKRAEKGPGRPGAPQRVPVTPHHRLGWSWRPAAGSATEGTRPSQPARAGRTETRRALQAAAPGARTAPIMKGGGPPVRPANRPFDRRPGKTGQNHPVRRGLTQGCRRSDRRQEDNKTAPLPDPGRRPKGGGRTMTPAPPAERPHGPGKPPPRAPSRPFSAEAGTSGNPGNWR